MAPAPAPAILCIVREAVQEFPLKRFIDEIAAALAWLLLPVLAVVCLSQAVRAQAGDGETEALRRGNQAFGKGHYLQALSAYEQVLGMNANNPVARFNGAESLSQICLFRHAVAEYTTVLQLMPNYEPALYGRGLAHLKLKEFREANADFAAAVRAEPRDIDAYNMEALTLIELGQGPAALENLKKVATMASKLGKQGGWRTLYGQGMVLARLGQTADAIAALSESLKVNPNAVDALYERASIYTKGSDFRSALSDLERAIAINPENPTGYLLRGLTLARAGQVEPAVKDFSAAISLSPDYEVPYYNRALAYHKMERQREALADLDKAIELNPQYTKAIQARQMLSR